MELFDTHCHVHSDGYELPPDRVLAEAADAGVGRLICVGTNPDDSRRALDFAAAHHNCWASVGLHPHDASLGRDSFRQLAQLVGQPKLVAIGECGLDYFYSHSPKRDQLAALKFQLELAAEHGLALILHVREAFDDFWPVFDSYQSAGQPLTGVVHSFSAGSSALAPILDRGLYVGLNGIMTFSKDPDQLAAARDVPLSRLLLETDAPFLTPPPYRGKVNQPKYVGLVAQFLADLRGEEVADLASATTANAIELFGLKDK